MSSGAGDKKCTCRHSKCVKLYCVCWAAGEGGEGEKGGQKGHEGKGQLGAASDGRAAVVGGVAPVPA